MDAVDGVRQVIDDNRLRPVAVLLTHGHLDHTWSVVPIAQGYGIPAFIHSDDDNMLSDPSTALSPDMQHLLRQMSDEELNLC